jgi:ABC-type Zn uptake system ZnuABC Zn-binding protein ZnuA
LILGIALVSAAISACGDDDPASNSAGGGDRIKVVATIAPIEALTREVAGDRVELHGIVPVGADAHEFEPVASDLQAIEDADVILRHGIALDDWLDDTLDANRDAMVTTVTEGIDLQPPALEHAHEDEEHEDDGEGEEHADESPEAGGDAHADEEGDHDEEGLDPHVWHDPDRAKIMVTNIAEALATADPDNAATYRANAAAYNGKLDETKVQVQAIIDEIPAESRKLVTNHDAFGYFADAFGLEIVGSVIPSTTTESEPSAEDTAALLDTIEREGVKAIFAESSVNASLAETLADDAGVLIVDDLYGDSLGEEGSGADTVHGMLLANARKIADALK